MMWIFNNADSAFDYYKSQILNKGVDFDDTKALFNVGFTIENPMDNHISCKQRNWKKIMLKLNGNGI